MKVGDIVKNRLEILMPFLFIFSCGKKGREVNYLVDNIPLEKIIGKNITQLYGDVEVTNIPLVLLDLIEINIGDSIRIYFDDIAQFDFIVEKLNPKELDDKRRVLSTYQMNQNVLYYFRDNIPLANEIVLINDNDLKMVT